MSENQEVSYPDLEIYLKRVATPDIIMWLDVTLGVRSQSSSGAKTQCLLSGDIPCTIFENAVKGGYTSVWFPQNGTRWSTDEACAEAAFTYFQQEVRCSTGSWSGDDEQGWIRFTESGKTVVNWFV